MSDNSALPPGPAPVHKPDAPITKASIGSLRLRQISDLSQVDQADWNRLSQHNPFVDYRYLAALERGGAVGAESGWVPCHLLAEQEGQLVGAVPLYEKSHSYGEFVFDWAWADAAQRAGLPYYPKLLAASPLTPVAGPRLMAGDDDIVRLALAQGLQQICSDADLSSVHVNFVDDNDAAALAQAGFLARSDWQYHWQNRDYENFDQFLAALSHKKRKNIRQERRKLRDAGWTFERLTGDQADDWHWDFIFAIYRNTFERKGNWPLLTKEIFRQLGQQFGEQVLLVLAQRDGQYQAGAWLIHDHHTLYGRYWGSFSDGPGLHFETCYYQGIEFCLEHKLQVFNPGAQGLHKVARGFEPVKTQSFHELSHPGLRDAVRRSLELEARHQEQRGDALREHSAFRQVPGQGQEQGQGQGPEQG